MGHTNVFPIAERRGEEAGATWESPHTTAGIIVHNQILHSTALRSE